MIVLEAERLNQERERSGLSCTPFAQQKISLHALCTDTELKQPLARLGSTKGKLCKWNHVYTEAILNKFCLPVLSEDVRVLLVERDCCSLSLFCIQFPV